jgi:hypothetical protein
MWTHADTMWTQADCLQKCGQMRTINTDSTDTSTMQRAINGKRYRMVWYTSDPGSQHNILRWLSWRCVPWRIRQELILWTLQTTVDKRCGLMRAVHNNAEKCRQTAEKCGQIADVWEWKSFDIERLCLVTYAYLCIIFTLFFSRAKVHTVHST